MLSLVTVVLLGSLLSSSLAKFPYPINETYMIQAFGRNLVWEPRDGELNSGNEIVLSPLNPNRLTQFWVTRSDGRVYNAAAPGYIRPDWHGIEGHNATLVLNKAYADTQLWFTYSGEDAPHFQINAMSGLHYCVRGHGAGLPLILTYCNPADAYPYQRFVYNKNYTLPL